VLVKPLPAGWGPAGASPAPVPGDAGGGADSQHRCAAIPARLQCMPLGLLPCALMLLFYGARKLNMPVEPRPPVNCCPCLGPAAPPLHLQW
jgi:hypothetical protein